MVPIVLHYIRLGLQMWGRGIHGVFHLSVTFSADSTHSHMLYVSAGIKATSAEVLSSHAVPEFGDIFYITWEI